jgi:hypothetical protein
LHRFVGCLKVRWNLLGSREVAENGRVIARFSTVAWKEKDRRDRRTRILNRITDLRLEGRDFAREVSLGVLQPRERHFGELLVTLPMLATAEFAVGEFFEEPKRLSAIKAVHG